MHRERALRLDQCERTGGRHHSIVRVDVVFDKNRDSVQWTTRSFLFAFAIEMRPRSSPRPGFISITELKRRTFLIDLGDAIGVFLDELL